MKKWLLVLLILIVAGVIAAAMIYIFYINKPHPDFEKLPAEYTLKAEELFGEYITVRDSADKNYTGRIIEISGNLTKVESADTLVVAVFVFDQGMFGDEGIRCTMLPAYKEEILKITPGAFVRIKGFCSGYNDTDVIFEKASLVKE